MEKDLDKDHHNLLSCKSSFADLNDQQKIALLETLLFVSGEPVSEVDLLAIFGCSPASLKELVVNLRDQLSAENRGFELIQVAGNKLHLRSKKNFAPFIKQLLVSANRKLSGQSLETLAIVAYKQPVMKSEIEKIRGVDPTPTLNSLVERQLVKVVGIKDTVGQPVLYGTTEEFLKVFGLNDLSELPKLSDSGDIAQALSANYSQVDKSLEVEKTEEAGIGSQAD
ncbi:MAG TPA: SMC-Scp complex subunit ScpB [Oligoflexia bacterium]|nr:SMC-Scp complex subunit ScpB [Oligoflexia bacterium]HMP27134.1 SMC-Scp complex subunit ScpB [Oligoflexia bacterium]